MIEKNGIKNKENKLYFTYLKEGKSEYREKIIIGNYWLVVYIAKKYMSSNYELDDLIGTGVIGLIKAVDSYKIEKNINFSTYAAKCITNEIFLLFRHKQNNISIYEPIISDEELTIADTLESDIDVEKEAIENVFLLENMPLIYSVLEKFDNWKREAFLDYFGINGNRLDQRQLSIKYNVSQSYISRIIKKIITDINKELNPKVLTKSKNGNTIYM